MTTLIVDQEATGKSAAEEPECEDHGCEGDLEAACAAFKGSVSSPATISIQYIRLIHVKLI